MDQGQSPKQWTFVTALEPAQFQNPSSKWLVRSAVKRDYLRSRRSKPRSGPRMIAPRERSIAQSSALHTLEVEATQSLTSDNLAGNGTQREQGNASNMHVVQINYTGAAARTSASFVPDWILGTHVWRTEDAMAAFNIPQRYYGYYSDVINHFLTIIVPVWLRFDEHGPSSFVDNQLKAAMKSRPVLECLVAFSFSHQDCLNRRLVGHRARRHNTEAVRMINDSLNNATWDDSTIMAVALMCITSATLVADPIQTKDEHLKEIEIHMDGMETMVKLRGGIYNLGMNGALNEIICWLDQLVTELTSKPPRFAPPSGIPAIPLIDKPNYAVDLTSPIPWSIFMLAPQNTEPERSVLGILSQLAHLTHTQADLAQSKNQDQAQHAAFEKLLASMEQHTATYLSKAPVAESLTQVEPFREATCIAGSIYTELQFRHAEPSASNLQVLKERLVSVLTHLNFENIAPNRLPTEGPFLLWILFCGGILCMGVEERGFFVERIARLVELLGLKLWEEVEGILRGYLWTERVGAWICLVLWDEVDMARRRPSEMDVRQ